MSAESIVRLSRYRIWRESGLKARQFADGGPDKPVQRGEAVVVGLEKLFLTGRLAERSGETYAAVRFLIRYATVRCSAQ